METPSSCSSRHADYFDRDLDLCRRMPPDGVLVADIRWTDVALRPNRATMSYSVLLTG